VREEEREKVEQMEMEDKKLKKGLTMECGRFRCADYCTKCIRVCPIKVN